MAQESKEMTLALHTTTGARISGRWGLLFMLFSLIVLAENSARLDILPTDDDLPTEEIYNSAAGWRNPAANENEWRQGRRQPASRIQFGYDSAYEEMRARDNNPGLDTGLDGIDHPQNTQLRIRF
jgi:hypothetical protein